MLRYLALAILALTFAATAADDLSRTKTVKMDLYTVSAPATKGWVTKKDKRSKAINIAKRSITGQGRGTEGIALAANLCAIPGHLRFQQSER